MRSLVVAALLFVAGGCLDVDSADGTLTCSTVPGRACPHGFYCAWDDKCYRNGDPAPAPQSQPPGPGSVTPPDLSVPWSPPDGFWSPPDMTMSTDDLSSTD